MLRIIPATHKHLNVCLEMLLDSKLGEVYFSNHDHALKSLMDGLENEKVIIAQDADGHYVGFLWYVRYGAFHAFPYLHIIAVKREYRGRGYGKELMRHLEEEILNQKGKLFLVVADFNSDAERLYEKLGYKQVGQIPNLYKEGVTEHLMMKVLG